MSQEAVEKRKELVGMLEDAGTLIKSLRDLPEVVSGEKRSPTPSAVWDAKQRTAAILVDLCSRINEMNLSDCFFRQDVYLILACAGSMAGWSSKWQTIKGPLFWNIETGKPEPRVNTLDFLICYARGIRVDKRELEDTYPFMKAA